MPLAVERCVSSLLAKWKKDPSSRPKPRSKGKDGKPQDAKSQAWAICTAAAKKAGKMEGDADIALEGEEEIAFPNPVMTGVAVTNRPHLQGLSPISIVEEAGRKLLKVPVLLYGKWRHKDGILNFTREFVDQIKKAFHDKVAGHEIAVDCRHLPQLGALAWLERIVEETRGDGQTEVSVLGEPTPDGEQIVENQKFRYGSIEFQTNFQDRRAAALSTDDVEGLWEEEGPCCDDIDLEEAMKYLEEGETMSEQDGVTLEALEALQAQVAELTQAKEAKDEAVTRLEQQLETERERTTQMEQALVEQFVEAIVAKATHYRDADRRAHSKVFLEWLNDVMLCKPIGEDGSTIQLEEGANVRDLHTYYRRSIAWLAENMPGVVPMRQTGTEPDKERSLEAGEPTELSDDAKAEIADVWGVVPSAPAANVGAE